MDALTSIRHLQDGLAYSTHHSDSMVSIQLPTAIYQENLQYICWGSVQEQQQQQHGSPATTATIISPLNAVSTAAGEGMQQTSSAHEIVASIYQQYRMHHRIVPTSTNIMSISSIQDICDQLFTPAHIHQLVELIHRHHTSCVDCLHDQSMLRLCYDVLYEAIYAYGLIQYADLQLLRQHSQCSVQSRVFWEKVDYYIQAWKHVYHTYIQGQTRLGEYVQSMQGQGTGVQWYRMLSDQAVDTLRFHHHQLHSVHRSYMTPLQMRSCQTSNQCFNSLQSKILSGYTLPPSGLQYYIYAFLTSLPADLDSILSLVLREVCMHSNSEQSVNIHTPVLLVQAIEDVAKRICHGNSSGHSLDEIQTAFETAVEIS